MIVVAYSFAHFHPVDKPIPQSSAGVIAKKIYDEAIKFEGSSNVLYIDPDIPLSWGPSITVDILISRASNYSLLLRHFKPKRDLLIAVNQHPESRKRIKKQLREVGLPAEALDSTDGIHESGKQISSASKIILVGNGITRNTYLENGFKSKDLFPLTYVSTKIDFKYRPENQSNILAHIGSIGFRKGADVLFGIADSLREQESSAKLVITGEPVNTFWSKELQNALQRNPDHLEHLGWVDINSISFLETLRNTKFALFPTREEGLSGAYLEIANTGIPVITTNQVGIETIEELLAPLTNEFISRTNELLSASPGEIEEISEASLKWMESVCNSNDQMTDAIERFLSIGRVWPKADIKLCVHNKSKTVASLITGWSKAAQLTDNTSITVIDDGSTDKSAEIISKVLEKTSNFQNKKFFYLPDVFEVKSNNAAIRATDADYHVIVQDDNHIVNFDLLPEMIALADKSRNIAALGGLAGANFYPISPECKIHSPGQHASGKHEHYWRQDKDTDPKFSERYFEVDAVMRGPLLMSDKAIQKIGDLDESYAPLYMDDVEWCARARKNSWRVVAMLGGVINQSETMGNASEAQSSIYEEAYRRNTSKFYNSYKITEGKKHLNIKREIWASTRTPIRTKVKFIFVPEIRNSFQKIRILLYAKHPLVARKLQLIKHKMTK